MSIERLRRLAGLPPMAINEAEMTDEQKLAQWEKSFADEVDPRARSVAKLQIEKLKKKLGKA